MRAGHTQALPSTFYIPQGLFPNVGFLFSGHDIPAILSLLDREDDIFRRAIGEGARENDR